MKKQILILTIIIALLLIISIFTIVLANGNLIGRVINNPDTNESNREFDYTWTTAICDGNKCRDYEIACLDGEAIRMDPVSGMVIFSDDWVDGREDKELCGS